MSLTFRSVGTSVGLSLLLFGPPVLAQPPQPEAHGINASVSPDGRRVAFVSTRDGVEDVYVMDAEGGDVRRLTALGHVSRPHWLDASHLLFSVAENETAHVYTIGLDGNAAQEIARLDARGVPVPARGASRLIYGVGSWTEMQMVASRADGSDRVALTSDRAAYWCPAVSPNGDQVAASRKDASDMQIWLLKTDGSGGRQLTHFPQDQGRPQCPAFSADGAALAVQSDVAAPADPSRHVGHVWIVNATTGEATRLAAHSSPYVDELPSWFPDGRRLAFQSDRTGRWEIWVMNVDGTGVRQLTR